MPKILITGAGGAAANNFHDAVSLAGGYDFCGIDVSPHFLELSQIPNCYQVPSCVDEPEGYIKVLNDICRLEGVDFVHPQPDVEVAFLSANRDKIDAPMFLPDDKTIKACQDKWETRQRLNLEKVPVPFAWDLDFWHVDTVKEFFVQWFNLHDKGWLRAKKGAGSKASLPISSPVQGVGWLEYWQSRGLHPTDFMISEFLPGREFAYQSVWYKGELIVGGLRERVEYLNGSLMPSGQSSSPSLAVTSSNTKAIDVAIQAITAVGNPHGVYGVDMKEDKHGTPCVTEINAGRFFTTSNFFAHAGLNMPEIYCELATDTFQDRPGRLDPLPDGIKWVRHMDVGFKLL